MSSNAHLSLSQGIDEVRALRTHFPVTRKILTGPTALAAKAHGRACTVLLCSHWEQYIRAVNEEAIQWLNQQACPIAQLPQELLLKHSQPAIDDMAITDWTRRADKLRAFVASDGAFWVPGGSTGTLDHSVLLTWMKSPKPKSVQRFYRQYGVPDILKEITRKESVRRRLYFDLSELVEKRNLIAHGDASTEALPSDITRYLTAVAKFADSADSALARVLRNLVGSAATRPW